LSRSALILFSRSHSLFSTAPQQQKEKEKDKEFLLLHQILLTPLKVLIVIIFIDLLIAGFLRLGGRFGEVDRLAACSPPTADDVLRGDGFKVVLASFFIFICGVPPVST
jgi:hypothetical protein